MQFNLIITQKNSGINNNNNIIILICLWIFKGEIFGKFMISCEFCMVHATAVLSDFCFLVIYWFNNKLKLLLYQSVNQFNIHISSFVSSL